MPMFERSSCAGSQVPIRLLAVTPEDSHIVGCKARLQVPTGIYIGAEPSLRL